MKAEEQEVFWKPCLGIKQLLRAILHIVIIIIIINNNNNNNNYKTSIASISSRRIEPSFAPRIGFGTLIVQEQCKVHQQMIRWIWNLGRISRSEKINFQMAMEWTYAIYWLNLFGESMPKIRDSNWKRTSSRMSFILDNR